MKDKGIVLLADGKILCTDEKVKQNADKPLTTQLKQTKKPDTKYEEYHVWVPVPQSGETRMNDFPYFFLEQPDSGAQQQPRLLH